MNPDRKITRDRMFKPLLAACPTFRPAWEKFLAEWRDEPGELPQYLALGDLGRHVIDLLNEAQLDAVRKVFEVVEAWHTRGEHYVREAATIGFLETLDNILSHDPDGSAVQARLRAFAGPETERWWSKLDRFWEGDARALADDEAAVGSRADSSGSLERRIAKRFGVPHSLRGGMVLIASSDADAFLVGCESVGACVLGIEGFRIVEGATIPDMSLILDLTMGGKVPSARDSVRAARLFLREHVPSDVLLDFTLAAEGG